MSRNNEISEPIINSPFCEPKRHWHISQLEPPKLIHERRKATYYYNPPPNKNNGQKEPGREVELELVNKIRERLAKWRELALQGGGGVTRVTMELMNHWRDNERKHRLFFAQLEAAETIIFLNEARPEFLQGIDIPLDEPGEEKKRVGYKAFKRLCCKMATGGGKTTVMAMLAAWSILNNLASGRYSAAVLVVCPNVTIRDRLAELNPKRGRASIYWTRDLIPPHFRKIIMGGKVFATNWHVFEERVFGGAGSPEEVGKPVEVRETIYIGNKPTTLRGKRYLPKADLVQKVTSGQYDLLSERRDSSGELVSAEVLWIKYVESDAALTSRALEKELEGAKNIMVFNDEAHHAYRLSHTKSEKDDKKKKAEESEEDNASAFGEESQIEQYYKEATVWIDGLDKIHKEQTIYQCVDFSATPYFLGKAGKNTKKCFPWTVSNFGLHDAIEAGLVKIPQLASRDSTGANLSRYFDLWKYVNEQLTPGERGGGRGEASPAAILKHAYTPIVTLGAYWDSMRKEWEAQKKPRPPVFILVCKTTKLAKVIYEWLAEDKPPTPAIPSAPLPALRNTERKQYTMRIDSKVQQEIESGNAKSDETRWMRFVLDTVGKTEWNRGSQGQSMPPKEFKELAKKLGREKFLEYPPGRDVRCIVSVAMLTEGWDCNTVTHIVGLRPFMSELLCEQVVGRGLRRESYEAKMGEAANETLELMDEEIASILGVPMTLYPVKAVEPKSPKPEREKFHIHAVQGREKYAIEFPRVDGYRQKAPPLLQCNVDNMAKLTISPNDQIPRSVKLTSGFCDNNGVFSPYTPGEPKEITIEKFREIARLQGVKFKVAAAIAKELREGKEDALPACALLEQVYAIVDNYIERRVKVEKGANIKDIYLPEYYGRLIENLRDGITQTGGMELPTYERDREKGNTKDVDFFTVREPYPIDKSHINALVPDTPKFEQSAGYALDNCPQVAAFVKNEGLGFAIAYTQGGVTREYRPDFIVRLQNGVHLVLETKQSRDDYKDKKKEAAERWARAVTADGKGVWRYAMVDNVADIDTTIGELCPPSAA